MPRANRAVTERGARRAVPLAAICTMLGVNKVCALCPQVVNTDPTADTDFNIGGLNMCSTSTMSRNLHGYSSALRHIYVHCVCLGHPIASFAHNVAQQRVKYGTCAAATPT